LTIGAIFKLVLLIHYIIAKGSDSWYYVRMANAWNPNFFYAWKHKWI